MSSSNKVWSDDGELFNHDSLYEIIGSMGLEAGHIVHVGESAPVDATRFIDADDVIEMLGERAWDEVGEAASDYPDVSPEAREELGELLSAWIAKHAAPKFYRVKKVREYTITEQDVAAAAQ